MRVRALSLVLAIILAVGLAGVAQAEAAGAGAPKYVFLFIGDGMGTAHRQLAEYGNQYLTGDPGALLVMDSLPHGGSMFTTPKDTASITDSAAAGSAMATGRKHLNGTLAIDENGQPLVTIAELAKREGRALGIVSNGKVAGATPASFTVHIADRDLQNEIADQQFELGIDFYGCSGYRNLVPKDHPSGKSERTDERDLVAEYKAAGYDTFVTEESAASFRAYQPTAGSKVLAAFTSGSYPYELDQKLEGLNIPSLAEVTQKGIDLLSQRESGFFFLIEDDVLDDCGHYNDAASVIYNTLALDRAVQAALDFYQAHPDETLIVVAADHETGGLGIGTGFDYTLHIDELLAHKGSIEGNIAYEKGDAEGYYELIQELYGFEPSDEQKQQLEAEMALLDQQDEIPDIEENALYQMTVDMINAKENIGFTTWEHTANPVPYTAIGAGADRLDGYIDNTELARRMADIMGLDLP